jgi:hypothetical protein
MGPTEFKQFAKSHSRPEQTNGQKPLETRKEAIQPNEAIPLPQVYGRHSPQARKPRKDTGPKAEKRHRSEGREKPQAYKKGSHRNAPKHSSKFLPKRLGQKIHTKRGQHTKRNQNHPKEEPPSQTINLNQKAPMKIHIKKNPHDLETKEGTSQMVSEKQSMANQDEWKLRQLDWKTKLGREHSRKQNN